MYAITIYSDCGSDIITHNINYYLKIQVAFNIHSNLLHIFITRKLKTLLVYWNKFFALII